jgi:hypothetical protein
MVKVRKDLTGMKFGKLTVIEQADDHISANGKRRSQWLCQCDCGSDPVVIIGSSLTKNNRSTKSCGCFNIAKTKEANKKYNKYDLTGQYGVGWTSNTNREFYFDLEDFDLIKDYCWSEHIGTTGYSRLEAWSSENGGMLRMTELLSKEKHDHIDRNPLNNQKANLREATFRENTRNHSKYKNNTSGIIGVSWDKSKNKWLSYIGMNGKTIQLGTYVDIYDATVSRLKAEVRYFGKDFAPQRHLFDEYGITTQNDYEVVE